MSDAIRICTLLMTSGAAVWGAADHSHGRGGASLFAEAQGSTSQVRPPSAGALAIPVACRSGTRESRLLLTVGHGPPRIGAGAHRIAKWRRLSRSAAWISAGDGVRGWRESGRHHGRGGHPPPARQPSVRGRDQRERRLRELGAGVAAGAAAADAGPPRGPSPPRPPPPAPAVRLLSPLELRR